MTLASAAYNCLWAIIRNGAFSAATMSARAAQEMRHSQQLGQMHHPCAHTTNNRTLQKQRLPLSIAHGNGPLTVNSCCVTMVNHTLVLRLGPIAYFVVVLDEQKIYNLLFCLIKRAHFFYFW